MPTQEVSDGALILLGGALLLTPGFVTDVVGLLLVIPFTRAFVKKRFRAFLSRRVSARYGVSTRSGSPGTRVSGRSDSRESVYEAKVVKVERNARPKERDPGSPSLPETAPRDEDDSPGRE